MEFFRYYQYQYQWSTICDDGWDDNDAVVVCKQLGYSGGSASYFGQGTGPALMTNVNCSRNEISIFGCSGNDRASTCSSGKDAGVVCVGEGLTGMDCDCVV